MTAALCVEGLSKRFGAALALDSVSFAVDAGAFCALVGPSGCGKTTLLRLIAGLETQSAGSIRIDGRDASALSPAQRGIGMVFQSYALFPNLSALDNVMFALGGQKRWRNAKDRRARALAMLDLVELSAFSARKPAQLSGGQQQRVALARALAPEPRLLLLDEPLSALDPHVRASLRGELKALQRRVGVTTIMVTHDREEALALADLLVVLRAGRLEQAASPRDVVAHPKSPFVADFVAEMSLLPAIAAPGAVRLGASSIQGVAHGFAEGAPVLLAVPPDAVSLGGGAPAMIVAAEFTGRALKLAARLESGALVRVDLADRNGPEPGAAVGLAIAPERVRVFPADA